MKKKINNNLPKETSAENEFMTGLNSPIYKDYYSYANYVSNTEVKEDIVDGYNTPYPLIYQDNYDARQVLKDTSILDKVTNNITRDRFFQMVRNCTNGLLYSIYQTLIYDFKQKNIPQDYIKYINIADSGKLIIENTDSSSVLYKLFDIMVDIVSGNDKIDNQAYFNLYINGIISYIFDTIHFEFSLKLAGLDPSIFNEIMDIVTKCMVVFHDNLLYSVSNFGMSLMNNKEFLGSVKNIKSKYQ